MKTSVRSPVMNANKLMQKQGKKRKDIPEKTLNNLFVVLNSYHFVWHCYSRIFLRKNIPAANGKESMYKILN
jgi:hypothetical protein